MKFPDLPLPSSPKHSNHIQRLKPEAFEGRDYHNERDTKIGWKNGAGVAQLDRASDFGSEG